MEEHKLDAETIRVNLARAQERFNQARIEYDEASRVLAWWQQGAKMFGGATHEAPDLDSPDDSVTLRGSALATSNVTGVLCVDDGTDAQPADHYADVSSQDRAAAEIAVDELLPEGLGTDRPTLRQAIMLVMRAHTRGSWSVADIEGMLRLNGWLPQGDSAKRITDVAGAMVREGHLRRTGRGIYRPSAPFALALEKFLPPITDYRTGAAGGIPAPDHPAASEGLRET
jgi:hypothetical protein